MCLISRIPIFKWIYGHAEVLKLQGANDREISKQLRESKDGFFTQMDNVEWACTSVALPRPEDTRGPGEEIPSETASAGTC